MKPIIRSNFPGGFSAIRLIVTIAFFVLSATAAVFGFMCVGSILFFLAVLQLAAEIDRLLKWRCPYCQERLLRVTGTGGIWYEDFREERVYWGECMGCGRSAIRRGTIFTTWTVYPDPELPVVARPGSE